MGKILPGAYFGRFLMVIYILSMTSLGAIQMFAVILVKAAFFCFLRSFLLAQKGTKKGPAADYTPAAEGSLIKLWCYCSFNISNSTSERRPKQRL
jgi:hypothetical protein